MLNRTEAICRGTMCPHYKFETYENKTDEQRWMKATCDLTPGQPLFNMRDSGEFVEELLLLQPCVAPPVYVAPAKG